LYQPGVNRIFGAVSNTSVVLPGPRATTKKSPAEEETLKVDPGETARVASLETQEGIRREKANPSAGTPDTVTLTVSSKGYAVSTRTETSTEVECVL